MRQLYSPPEHLGWEKARKEVMKIFEPDSALKVSVDQRIVAAEALGHAADPGHKPIRPDMLPVPLCGEVLLGRYPVTVAEYKRFVDNDAYCEPRFWIEGWKTKWKGCGNKPKNWEEQIEHLNRPVVYVSWYEARAYCAWVSELTGKDYCLPSEMEWYAAARNPEGEYPWGKAKPDAEIMNFYEKVGRLTPIGVYTAGAAPGGHLDMSGNVWEWCEDDWHINAKDASDDYSAWIDTPRYDYRVVRGGSWKTYEWYCKSTYRGCFALGGVYEHVGFRLAMSVAHDP